MKLDWLEIFSNISKLINKKNNEEEGASCTTVS